MPPPPPGPPARRPRRERAARRDAVDRTEVAFGGIDVVANNAGYGLFGGVEEADDAQARAIFDTNVFGVLNVLRATLPVLRRRRGGHILQGSSFLGQTTPAGLGLLAATKYAVEGLSDALAAEVAPLGIKVTLVQPGPTDTAFGSNLTTAASPQADYHATVRAPQPAAKASDPGRVAAAVRTAVADPNPPRRLALGASSGDMMLAALTARIDDLETWDHVTRGVDA